MTFFSNGAEQNVRVACVKNRTVLSSTLADVFARRHRKYVIPPLRTRRTRGGNGGRAGGGCRGNLHDRSVIGNDRETRGIQAENYIRAWFGIRAARKWKQKCQRRVGGGYGRGMIQKGSFPPTSPINPFLVLSRFPRRAEEREREK